MDEGERAAVSFPIVTILQNSSDSRLKRLSEIDAEILTIRKQKVANLDLFSADIIKINEDIEARISKLIDDGNRSLISTSSSLKAQIDRLLFKKTEIMGTGADTSDALKALFDERALIQLGLKNTWRHYETDQ